METINISSLRLGLMYALLFLPIALLFTLKIPLIKTLFISFIRMSIQLVLVGLYLGFIFEKNSAILTLLWIAIMLIVANYSVLKATKLSYRIFIPITLPGMFLSVTMVLFYLLFVVIQPTPWFDARYLIPMGGMILGNSLQSLIISLDRYTALLKKSKNELYSSFCMGATRREALRPYLQEALQAAIAPALTGIATIGLVSLPGMMTGQLLGGSFPLVAIKYQIVIMIAIFTAQIVAATLNLYLCSRAFLDENNRLLL